MVGVQQLSFLILNDDGREVHDSRKRKSFNFIKVECLPCSKQQVKAFITFPKEEEIRCHTQRHTHTYFKSD